MKSAVGAAQVALAMPLAMAAALAMAAGLPRSAWAAPDHATGTVGTLTWANWDGQQVMSPASYSQPESEPEIVAAVLRARARGRRLKVVGSGHSFSPIAMADAPPPNAGTGGTDVLSLDYYASLVGTGTAVLAAQPAGTRCRRPRGGAAPLDPSAAGGCEVSTVTVQAGMRMKAVNSLLDGMSPPQALPNLGAISEQSVAGATATATHGTGFQIGSISSGILGLRIVLANGTVVDCSATQNPTLFAAARVGLGALGVVSTVTLATVPAFHLQQLVVSYRSLDLLLSDLPRLQADPVYARLQWYWFPYNDTSATLLLRVPTTQPITPGGCWGHADGSSSSASGTVASASTAERLTGLLTGQHQPQLQHAKASAGGSGSGLGGRVDAAVLAMVGNGTVVSSCVDKSYKTLTHDGDDADRYTEMEMWVPMAHYPTGATAATRAATAADSKGAHKGEVARTTAHLTPEQPHADVLAALAAVAADAAPRGTGASLIDQLVAQYRAFQNSSAVRSRHDPSVRLFTGVRYVAGDDVSLLSMTAPPPHAATPAVPAWAVVSTIVMGNATTTGSPAEFSMYAHGLQALALALGGRPHWGKQNWATAAQLAPTYPKWAQFAAVREQLDPDCLFANDYLRRVLGVCNNTAVTGDGDVLTGV